MNNPRLLTRRTFIVSAGTIAAGLAIVVHSPNAISGLLGDNAGKAFKPNAFVEISSDGQIVVLVGQSEIGQGIHTCLAQALAEELDADWSMVTARHSPAGDEYQLAPDVFGPGIQMIAQSSSTRYLFEPMRMAGAVARLLIVRAAAKAWGLSEDKCTTANGYVLAADGRKAPYGEFVVDAAKLPMPAAGDVRLKSPETFKLIGKSMPRIEGKDKITGQPIFGIDVRLPGMLTAVVARSPILGGKAIRVDDSASKKVPGVKACLQIADGVAVIAENFWAAKTARALLKIEWDSGPRGTMSSEVMEAEYRQALGKPGLVVLERGRTDALMSDSGGGHLADYTMPYMAHAPMEPLNCTMQWQGDACEIWVGTMYQSMDHKVASEILGIPKEKVKLNTMHCGGGFGRRASPKSDFVAETARIMKAARHLGAPIQNIWTREDDIQGGEYRPMAFNRLSATLSPSGKIESWGHRIVSQSILDDTEFASWNAGGYDALSVGGAITLPYEIENFRLDIHTPKTGPTVSWMRAPGEVSNCFAVECFIDELAHRAKIDPVTFRLNMLGKDPRLAHVLNVAAKTGGLLERSPAGMGRGVAVHSYVDTRVAAVAEVTIADGHLRVSRITVVLDCGRVVNPDGVKAQVEGGVIFALSNALYGRISFDQGRAQQSNFDSYPVLRMDAAPEVLVHLVSSEEGPFGVGEVACPPVAPALCNAIYAATGKRFRDTPVSAAIDV
ncbi:xanthine dehydrogenase family protein molybdopterin-binding subunit [Pseudomonas cavernicola]|uniref:Xanthine dehydrogenase family protein molybdopterin-binding subunit n=1 Tax=Pseudomonas cavernicola TaxID=2320866 RepID=A0A418XME1_9PSED|nr:xanthine dehydrogenase family protein molybdopterin-binding subunit [Pseudomonas cavernicola]RJG13624.1 xanthine dehydrogenase family protein molybdopterin-binding subunit [Pseudomonas cavernicola]